MALQPACDGAREKDFQRYLRSEEHTSELQSPCKIVSRLLLEKKTLINYNDFVATLSVMISMPNLIPAYIRNNIVNKQYNIKATQTKKLILQQCNESTVVDTAD